MKIQQNCEEVCEWKWGLNIGVCSVYSALYYVNMHETERGGKSRVKLRYWVRGGGFQRKLMLHIDNTVFSSRGIFFEISPPPPYSLALLTRKELSLCHKLWFSNAYIFATQCRRPQIFQTMNSVRSNNLSL